MIGTVKRFMKFCRPQDTRKFRISIALGVLEAVFDAMRIPAIVIVLAALVTIGSDVRRAALQATAIMLASIVCSIIVRAVETMLQTEGGYDCAAFKRIEIARKLRHLPMGYFSAASLGEITSVTTNTMESLGDVATRVIMLTTKGVIETALVVIALFFFDWRVGLIALGGFLLFLLTNAALQRAGRSATERKARADTALVGVIMEYVQGISEVRSYDLAGREAGRLAAANEESRAANTKMEFAYIPWQCLQGIVTKLAACAIVMASALFYLSGSMTLTIALGMTVSAFLIYTGLETAGAYSALLHSIDVYMNRADAILDMDSMDTDGRDIEPQAHDIDMEKVDFSYEGRAIIDGVTLHVPSGGTTAIVGPSGAGKTTLARLMARFWDPDGGVVRLGGHDVREYGMDSLMANYSFVFQDVYLFHDTIENNIRFGTPGATREQVAEAARKARCDAFIDALPEGYDTVVGEGGASLSGGERQRLSIARAIMKDAPVVILDEATANVDPENELELMEAIDALTREKTVVKIAHRLKTVRNADNIVVLDHGRIVQQGTHSELMAEDGIYRRFVAARERSLSWKV